MPCWSVFGDGLKRMFGESRQKRKSSNSVAPIWRDNVQVVGRAGDGKLRVSANAETQIVLVTATVNDGQRVSAAYPVYIQGKAPVPPTPTTPDAPEK